MPFSELLKLSGVRRRLFPFVEDCNELDLLAAIGAAAERGEPLGNKQILLLEPFPPSTLQRLLKRLLDGRIIKRTRKAGDGRRVVYVLTAKTIKAFTEYLAEVRSVCHA